MESKTGRGRIWMLKGTLLSAALASACCWLPLVLLGFGVSGAAVGAAFEAWQPFFAVLTLALLGVGFYLSYRPVRAAACTADCCDTDGGNSRRTQRVMMWCMSPIALAMVLFPSYVSALFGSDGLGAFDGSPLVVMQLEGLTCEGCSVIIEEALDDAPGVRGVEVDYEASTARVAVDEEVSIEELSALVEGAGFQVLASRRDPGDGKP